MGYVTKTDAAELVRQYHKNIKIRRNGQLVVSGKCSGWFRKGDSKETYVTWRLVNAKPDLESVRVHPNKKPPKPKEGIWIA